MIFLAGFFIFLAVIIGALNKNIAIAEDKNNFVKGEVLVKFKEGVGSKEVNEIHKKLGGKVKSEIPGINVQVLDAGKKNTGELISDYAKNSKVKYAEPNFIASALTTDTYFEKQWGMNNFGQQTCNTAGNICTAGAEDADIDAPEAWAIASGSSEIKIAILDSGIDLNHPDLKNKIAASVNLTAASNTENDLYGHGTHVAGIAAADTNNGAGVAGVGYNSKLLNVKVLGDDGYGAYSWIANGIYWAVQNGAKVINMSLGANRKSSALEDAVNFAWNNGVVLTAAAGNSSNPSKTYPAYYNNVIAVAATNNNDVKTSFSSYGSWVDVTAPGENIYSTFPTHDFYLQNKYGRSKNYDFGSGTSMSTPHVSGLAALLWSTEFGTDNSTVRSRIETTADIVSGTGTYWAWGRINACNAVGGNCPYLISPSPTPEPTVEPTPTPSPSPEPNMCSACFKGVCDNNCNPKKDGLSCPDCQ